MRNRDAFFDEVNRRIKDSAGNKTTQENFRHLAGIADWHDYRLKSKPAGDLLPVLKGKRIANEYRADELPRGKTADLNTLLGDKDAPVYIEDEAGINNLDWNPSTHASLKMLISEKRVAIYELDTVDLAHFKPGVVFETKPKRTLRLANHEHFSKQSPQYMSLSQAQQGQDDDERRRRRSRVYIVVGLSKYGK